ncbi:DUF5777 family beta-barrel protein [Bacteroidota bacterium]
MKNPIKYIQKTTKTVHALMLASIMFLVFPVAGLFAQEADEKDNRPVSEPFGTTTLIDNQTTVGLYKGSLSLEIAHRFSEIKELGDLFGIYGSANTRLALDYGVSDRIMVGFGTTRDYKLQDFEWKVNLLTQTRSYSMPVSLSYYGNMVIDARSKENFGPEEDYNFSHRMSYLTQLIASSKFGPLSLQVIPTFAWFNGVDQGYNNINYGLSLGGRAQVLGSSSIIFEYDQPLSQHEAIDTKPNIGFGVEIGTGTHFFRVFATTYSDIIKQRNMFFNTNDPFAGKFRFGFNISVALR